MPLAFLRPNTARKEADEAKGRFAQASAILEIYQSMLSNNSAAEASTKANGNSQSNQNPPPAIGMRSTASMYADSLSKSLTKGNSEEAILASGVSAAFFPHGLGHSLGLDVHDVPSASKPLVNDTIGKGVELGHESFYAALRLRLPLEEGMVVLSFHDLRLHLDIV